MPQSIFGLGLGGAGIVGTLIVAGILLSLTGVSSNLGQIAIAGGVGIGILLGLMGVISVASRIF